jgi:Fic family protein
MDTGYIWQHPNWTSRLRWDSERLIEPLAKVRRRQGEILGKASGLRFDLELDSRASILVEEAVGTSAIEGELLDRDLVRSSVARRLGLPAAGLSPSTREVDGLVDVLFDASRNHAEPLTKGRLCSWHAALFPSGRSGLLPITVGDWRRGGEPMRVVSGPLGHEKTHFEAPPSANVAEEMRRFFEWFAAPGEPHDGILRAAVAHFRLVTIHPFEDGNGRLARAVSDMALARDEETGVRLYSLSSRIRAERDAYYSILERTQKSDGDLTDWLWWFTGCLERAIATSDDAIDFVRAKSHFWLHHRDTVINPRQRKVVNRMLDAGPGGFEGGLTNRKYVSMARTSRATAQREIAELLEKGVLVRRPGAGRSTSYDIDWEPNPKPL